MEWEEKVGTRSDPRSPTIAFIPYSVPTPDSVVSDMLI